jgi:Zn-dependent protease
MSDIEAEIRRQMLEERDRALRSQTSPLSAGGIDFPSVPPAGSPAPPLTSAGPSYQALPPPSFPAAPTSSYPAHYPPTPVYPAPYAAPVPASLPPPTTSAAPKSAPQKKGLLGGLGAIGIALAKFGGALKGLLVGLKFLTFGKYLFTAGTMLASIAVYSALLGWRFAVGLVLLIFIHEAGHAVAVKRLGYKLTAMVFIPLFGAYVQHEGGQSRADAAQIAIMGPVAGLLAGLACGAVYGITGSPLWLVLSYYSFFMNLFNLSAIPMLDGGRVTPLIPSKILLGGLLLNLLVNYRFPICWLLLLFALPQIIEQWRRNPADPALGVSKQDQQTYTLAYFGLVIFMGFAAITTQNWIWELRHLSRHF